MEAGMKTILNSRVRFSEVDEECNLSFGKIIDYLQDCSNLQSEQLGIGIDYQMETNRAWILSSWQIELKGNIKNGDNISVVTWPYEFKKAFGKRNYTIAKADSPEKNIIEADSMWVMFDISAGSLTRIVDSDIEKYEFDEQLPMNYETKKIVHGENYEKMDRHKVYRYHLDINHHVNNAWYVKIAEEYIADKAKIKSLRVEYKKSAKLGDTIIPYVCYDGNRYVIELRGIDDEIYVITEFSET